MAGTEPPTVPHPDAVPGGESARRPADPGVVGNERLTALAGGILLVLAVIEVVTVPALRSLLSVHFFVGVLLLGPLAVKTASTGWRFVRYYTRHPAYRRKGPPHPVLRLLAPLLLISTLAVLGSGIALALTGPAPAILLQTHLISFLAWLVTLVIHIGAYLARLPRLIAADWQHPTRPATAPGRQARLAVNVVALLAAGVAAVLLLPTTAPWSAWLGTGLAKVLLLYALVTGIAVVAVVRRRRRRDAHPANNPEK